MSRVTATNIQTWTHRGAAIFSCPEVIDAGGNSFEATAFGEWQDPSNGYVLIQKKSPAGAVLASVVVIPSGGMKLDTCWLSISGPHIRLTMGSHMPGAQDPESVTRDLYVWQNIAVPYPVGVAPMGAAGAYTPDQEPTPTPGVDVDYNRIINGVVAKLKEEFGGPFRDVLEDKAKDAIRELNMHSVSMQSRGVDQWERDRVYQTLDENCPGFWPWLRRQVMSPELAMMFEREQAAFAAKAEEMEADNG